MSCPRQVLRPRRGRSCSCKLQASGWCSTSDHVLAAVRAWLWSRVCARLLRLRCLGVLTALATVGQCSNWCVCGSGGSCNSTMCALIENATMVVHIMLLLLDSYPTKRQGGQCNRESTLRIIPKAGKRAKRAKNSDRLRLAKTYQDSPRHTYFSTGLQQLPLAAQWRLLGSALWWATWASAPRRRAFARRLAAGPTRSTSQ